MTRRTFTSAIVMGLCMVLAAAPAFSQSSAPYAPAAPLYALARLPASQSSGAPDEGRERHGGSFHPPLR